MRKLFLLITIIAFALSNEAILKIDTGGHNAKVNDVIITSDNKLISASNDKTIRIWDLETKKEEDRILGEIDYGFNGYIYAIALSPDEKYLAVGGVLGGRVTNDYNTDIRIYDFKTRKLINILSYHSIAISDLTFTPDGKFLISGSFDKSVKIIDTQTWKLRATFKGHTDYVRSVKAFDYNGETRIVSGGYDNGIYLFNLDGELINSVQLDSTFHYVEVGKYIVVTSEVNSKINIYDLDLNHIKTIDNGMVYPSRTALYGKYLLTGNLVPFINYIYDLDTFEKVSTFTQHNNIVTTLKLTKDYAITVDDDGYIFFWDYTGKKLGEIRGDGSSVAGTGFQGDTIGYGNTVKLLDIVNQSSKIESTFSNYKVGKATGEFKRISFEFENYSLEREDTLNFGDPVTTLNIKKDDKISAKIIKVPINGTRHNAYTFSDDGLVITAGISGFLEVYNRDGNILASLVGHIGAIWTLATDGYKLISSGSDQSIKLWDLREINTSAKIDFRTPEEIDPIMRTDLEEKYQIELSSDENIKYLYNLLMEKDLVHYTYMLTNLPEIDPIATLFIAENREWVIYTPDGLFDSSIDGDRYLGYHINKGRDKNAEFYRMSNEFKKYHRPDIIKEVLSNWKRVELQNQNPSISNINFTDNIRSGELIEFGLDVVDIENDKLTFVWNYGDRVKEKSISKSITHRYFESGEKTLLVSAVDDKGGKDIFQIDLNISSGDTIIDECELNSGLHILPKDGCEFKSNYALNEEIEFKLIFKNRSNETFLLEDLNECKVNEKLATLNLKENKIEFLREDYVNLTCVVNSQKKIQTFIVGDVDKSQKNGIIIVGKDSDDDELKSAFVNTGNKAYQYLREIGLSDEDITYYNSFGEQIIDGQQVVDKVEYNVFDVIEAIDSTPPSTNPMYLYIIDHGSPTGGVLITKFNKLYAKHIDKTLDAFQKRTDREVVVAVDTCYSEAHIDIMNDKNRLTMSSSKKDETALMSREGDISFSIYMIENLKKRYSMQESFAIAKESYESVVGASHPQSNFLDKRVMKRAINDRKRRDIAEFISFTGDLKLDNIDSVKLEVKLKNPNEQSIKAIITPPQTIIKNPNETTTEIKSDIINLIFNGDVFWNFYKFNEEGIYKILYEAVDYSGDLKRVTTTVQVGVSNKSIEFIDNSNTKSLTVNSGWNLVALPILDRVDKEFFDKTIWIHKDGIWIENPESIESEIGVFIYSDEKITYEFNGIDYKPNFFTSEKWTLLGTGEDLNAEDMSKLNLEFETIWLFRDSQWIKNPKNILSTEGFWVKAY